MSGEGRDALVMTCRHGSSTRWTVNPRARRHGSNGWDAGPPAEWCQLPPEGSLEAASAAVKAWERSLPADAQPGRVERLQAAHSSGLCSRPAPHWTGS